MYRTWYNYAAQFTRRTAENLPTFGLYWLVLSLKIFFDAIRLPAAETLVEGGGADALAQPPKRQAANAARGRIGSRCSGSRL